MSSKMTPPVTFNLVRICSVAEVDLAGARVRVDFGAGVLSAWLPVLAIRAGNARIWSPFSVGEQVVVLPTGEDEGVVLGALYSTTSPAPDSQADSLVVEFAEGSQLRIEKGQASLKLAGAMALEVSGDAEVKVSGNASINAQAIKLNGGKGVVTGDCICAMTGKPHLDASSVVFAGKA